MKNDCTDGGVTIAIEFDDEYTASVKERLQPDEWAQIEVTVDGTSIFNGGVRGLACSSVLDLLDSIIAMTRHESTIIEFDYGPMWLVVEPKDESELLVSRSSTWKGTEDPEARLDVDTSEQTTQTVWAKGVLNASEAFYDNVVAMNPDVEELKEMKEILDRKTEAESECRNAGIFD